MFEKDLKDFTIKSSLNSPATLEMELANESGQYDYFLDYSIIFSQPLYEFNISVNSQPTTVFVGYPIHVEKLYKQKTIKLSFADRSYWTRISKFSAEIQPEAYLNEVVTTLGVKYLGFNSNEIIINGNFTNDKYKVYRLHVSDEPLFARLDNIASLMNCVLYVDSQGNLNLSQLFQTPGTFYTLNERDLIEYSLTFGDLNSFENVYELIGSEKPIWEVELGDKENCLSVFTFDKFFVVKFWNRYILNYYPDNYWLQYKGQSYIPPTGGGPGLLFPSLGNLVQYPDGKIENSGATIVEVPLYGFKSVITDWEIKAWNRQTKGYDPDNNVNCVLLGYGTNNAYFYIDTTNSTNYFFALFVYGRTLNPNSQGIKYYGYQKYQTKYPVVEDITFKKNTNYYAKKYLEYNNQRVADLIGQYKLKTFNLDFVGSNTQAEALLTDLATSYIYRLNKVTAITSLNPGIDLLDMVELQIESQNLLIQFWAEEITHTKTNTTISGSLYYKGNLTVS